MDEMFPLHLLLSIMIVPLPATHAVSHEHQPTRYRRQSPHGPLPGNSSESVCITIRQATNTYEQTAAVCLRISASHIPIQAGLTSDHRPAEIHSLFLLQFKGHGFDPRKHTQLKNVIKWGLFKM